MMVTRPVCPEPSVAGSKAAENCEYAAMVRIQLASAASFGNSWLANWITKGVRPAPAWGERGTWTVTISSLLSPGPSRVMGELAETQLDGMPVTPRRKPSSCTPRLMRKIGMWTVEPGTAAKLVVPSSMPIRPGDS